MMIAVIPENAVLPHRGFVILTTNKIPRHSAGIDSPQQVRVIGNAFPEDQVSRAPVQI